MTAVTPAQIMADAQQKLFQPYRDAGVSFLDVPEWTWRKMPPPNVHGHVVSAYPSQQTVLARDVDRINDHPTRHMVMYNASMVHVVEAQLEDMMTVAGRQLIMFRKKQRARNTYRKILADYIAQEQASYGDTPPELPTYKGPALGDLLPRTQVRIPLPGQQNYFHGVWENLPQLVPLQDAKFKGEIIFRTPLQALPDFTQGFIELLFPDLVDRIVVQQAKPGPDYIKSRRCKNFYTGFDWSFYAQLVPGAKVDFGMPASAGDLDQYHRPDAFAFFFSFANGYTVHQKAFRDRAVAAVADMDFSHLPRRFWISRAGSARRPKMRGEDQLLAALQQKGFEPVRLETLTPAEQIGIFHNADMVAAQHGAGITNIMFAGPQTKVLEIGHGMTIERWRTFHPLAAVAGCRYEAFFTDYANDDPTARPDLKRDGFPVPDCTPGLIDAVLARVDALE